jgi:dTDP-4-amino-4,6-dideoxygalactose transaminase
MFEMNEIPHSKPFIGKEEEEKISEVILSGQIAQGRMVSEFESGMADLIGVKGAVACNSGTSALHLVMRAMDISPGDEVIIPSFTCSALLNAVRYTGASPVYAEIDPVNLNMDSNDVKGKITNRTKLIIVPHMFGESADIDGLLNHGIPVVEDCAQAIGAKHKNRMLGSFGEATVCSFYATKVITTGEGGMVLSNSTALLDKIRDLRDYDKKRSSELRYNYKMTDIQAAMGLIQMRRIGSFIERRRQIAIRYIDAFNDLPVELPTTKPGSIYYRFILKCSPETADYLIKEMKRRGIICERPIFMPLHHIYSEVPVTLSITEEMYQKCVSIPIYPALKDSEVSLIIEKIRELMEEPTE